MPRPHNHAGALFGPVRAEKVATEPDHRNAAQGEDDTADQEDPVDQRVAPGKSRSKDRAERDVRHPDQLKDKPEQSVVLAIGSPPLDISLPSPLVRAKMGSWNASIPAETCNPINRRSPKDPNKPDSLHHLIQIVELSVRAPARPPLPPQHLFAGIARRAAELLLYAEELVVLGEAV